MISQVTSLPITTAVTCPTTRIHPPAIIAQAAATAGLLTDGKRQVQPRRGYRGGPERARHGREVARGRGTPADPRRGRYDHRRIVHRRAAHLSWRALPGGDPRHYSVPRVPPPIYVSSLGEKSARLAAHCRRVYDGYICMGPQAELIKLYRDEGGADPASSATARGTLVEANVVRGRTLTSWPTLATDIRNAGGTWVDQEVVTNPGPRDQPRTRRPARLLRQDRRGVRRGLVPGTGSQHLTRVVRAANRASPDGWAGSGPGHMLPP